MKKTYCTLCGKYYDKDELIIEADYRILENIERCPNCKQEKYLITKDVDDGVKG